MRSAMAGHVRNELREPRADLLHLLEVLAERDYCRPHNGKGTAVEVTPIHTILVPGEGLPPEENFDANVETDVPVQRGRPAPIQEMPDGVEILSGLRASDRLVRP